METFNSTYLGIVVQNNDPEYRGRIKVWVPHINASVYNKWNALKKDRKFKFPGKNIDSDLSLIMDDLKDDLPWAEMASPIMGESSTGKYNARFDTASVSDASYAFSLSGSNYSNTLSANRLNEEKMGEKPGAIYEKYSTKLTDAFTNSTTKINPYGASYRPSTYSNAAKGIFSVPSVGTHVWVFFSSGIPYYPIYFAIAFGQQDFASIFRGEDDTYQDYPDTFENKEKRVNPGIDNDTTTYRNKMVLNQRGAAIEIINTTDRERFKVTHFGGGFLELNNQYNSLFSPKNLQLLTTRDKFETVRGHSSSHVGRDLESAIKGNYILNIGNLNKTAMDDWVTAYTAIADLLALPEGDSQKLALTSAIESQADLLAAAEAKLGFGGNLIETITKHKFTNIGLVFNTFASVRVSQTPKVVTQYRNVIVGGTELETENIDLVEYTFIDDMPGGNYTQTIGNRYDMLIGSGGLDIKTTGPITLGGTIIAAAGTQVNLASQQDFNIDGGTNLSIIADIMSIRSRSRNQVVIDDNLGISKNLIIGGGSYTEGEAYVQHITAPVEYQLSEKSTITAGAGTWSITGATISGTGTGPGGCYKSGDIVTLGTTGTLGITQTHQHFYKNIPLTLLENAAAVRSAATVLNGGSAAATATAVSDGYKSNPGSRTPPTDPRNN